jgi:hypothetical protein
MDARTRTAIAHMILRCRRAAQDYAHRPIRTAADVTIFPAMAEHYRTLLAGALEMLDTIRRS